MLLEALESAVKDWMEWIRSEQAWGEGRLWVVAHSRRKAGMLLSALRRRSLGNAAAWIGVEPVSLVELAAVLLRQADGVAGSFPRLCDDEAFELECLRRLRRIKPDEPPPTPASLRALASAVRELRDSGIPARVLRDCRVQEIAVRLVESFAVEEAATGREGGGCLDRASVFEKAGRLLERGELPGPFRSSMIVVLDTVRPSGAAGTFLLRLEATMGGSAVAGRPVPAFRRLPLRAVVGDAPAASGSLSSAAGGPPVLDIRPVACSDVDSEVRHLLRTLSVLLDNGVPPGEIEITASSYGEYVRRIFECAPLYLAHRSSPAEQAGKELEQWRNGVPGDAVRTMELFSFQQGIPLDLFPAMRLLNELVSLRKRPHALVERLRVMVSAGLLDFDLEGGGRGGEAMLRLLETIPPLLPRGSWSSGLDGLMKRLEEGAGDDGRGKVRGTLVRLLREIAPFLEPAGEGAEDAASFLMQAATFVARWCAARSQLDVAAGRVVRGVLVDIARQALADPGGGTRFDWVEWALRRLASKVIAAGGARPDAVHIAPLVGGGHGGRSFVFVLGLDTSRFPGEVGTGGILDDATRRLLRAAAQEGAAVPPLPVREEVESERRDYLRYFLVEQYCIRSFGRSRGAACDERPAVIVLSRPSMAGDGESVLGWSSVVRELQYEDGSGTAGEGAPWRAWIAAMREQGRIELHREPPTIWRLPRSPEADARAWGCSAFEDELVRAMENRGAQGGKDAAGARRDGGGCGTPRIEAGDAAKLLGFVRWKEEGPPPVSIRVTAMDELLRCPYRFFWSRVAGVDERDVLERGEEEWLEPRERGTLVHEALSVFAERVCLPLLKALSSPAVGKSSPSLRGGGSAAETIARLRRRLEDGSLLAEALECAGRKAAQAPGRSLVHQIEQLRIMEWAVAAVMEEEVPAWLSCAELLLGCGKKGAGLGPARLEPAEYRFPLAWEIPLEGVVELSPPQGGPEADGSRGDGTLLLSLRGRLDRVDAVFTAEAAGDRLRFTRLEVVDYKSSRKPPAIWKTKQGKDTSVYPCMAQPYFYLAMLGGFPSSWSEWLRRAEADGGCGLGKEEADALLSWLRNLSPAGGAFGEKCDFVLVYPYASDRTKRRVRWSNVPGGADPREVSSAELHSRLVMLMEGRLPLAVHMVREGYAGAEAYCRYCPFEGACGAEEVP